MSGLSKESALRIALAARSLPDVETKDLVQGLISLLGYPISEKKLDKLSLWRFRKIQLVEGFEKKYLIEALNYLNGNNIQTKKEPLPAVEGYRDGDMPDSIRVAVASNEGSLINGHFGSCSRYLIYQVSPDEIRVIDIREVLDVNPEMDKNVARAEKIRDCQVLYTMSIGGPAAAKVVRAGIHPVKVPQGGVANLILQRLQEAIASSPPPWLAKAMGIKAEERVRFADEL